MKISWLVAVGSWSESVQYIIQESAGDSNLIGHPSVDGTVLAKIPPQQAGQVRIPWILGTPIAPVSSLPVSTWNPTLKSPSRGLPASVSLIGRLLIRRMKQTSVRRVDDTGNTNVVASNDRDYLVAAVESPLSQRCVPRFV